MFAVTVSDGTNTSAPANITIEIADDISNAVNDTNSVAEDAVAPIGGNVLTNDLHPNGQPGADTPRSFVSWNGSTTGTYGTFVANPDGTYSYTLNNGNALVQGLDNGESLTETFNYTMQDADGDTDTATLTITITGANDAPTLVVGSSESDDNEVPIRPTRFRGRARWTTTGRSTALAATTC